jgi:hypothetical protein
MLILKSSTTFVEISNYAVWNNALGKTKTFHINILFETKTGKCYIKNVIVILFFRHS